jgi:hypothetical protein
MEISDPFVESSPAQAYIADEPVNTRTKHRLVTILWFESFLNLAAARLWLKSVVNAA